MLAHLATYASIISLASAHFTLVEPFWRGDSFEKPRSQWTWPCAGVSQENSTTNRTEWPFTGGTVRAKFGHEWGLTYINLGLGDEVTSFNITLVEGFNQTGKGVFCLPEVGREALAALNLTDGQTGSVQVIQLSSRGSSMYNCADIVFRANAKLDENNAACANDTGVSAVALTSVGSPECEAGSGHGSGSGGSGDAGGSAAPGTTTPGAADAIRPSIAQTLVGVVAVGLAAVAAF